MELASEQVDRVIAAQLELKGWTIHGVSHSQEMKFGRNEKSEDHASKVTSCGKMSMFDTNSRQVELHIEVLGASKPQIAACVQLPTEWLIYLNA